MSRSVLFVSATIFGGLALGLAAQEGPRFPQGPPPTVALAVARQVGEVVELRLVVPELAVVTRKKFVERGGRTTEEEYRETAVVPRKVDVVLHDKGVMVLDTNGNKIGRARVLELLAEQTPVLVSATEKVERYYL